jgi:hypothetical protein
MKGLSLILIITLSVLAFAQAQPITVGTIDFYGYAGLDTERIRAALPLREGDVLSHESKEKTIDSIKRAVKQAVGREPSDVATLCCDEGGKVQIYIGLVGEQARHIRYNPAPHGSIRLPPSAIRVSREADEALSNALGRGVFGQDGSQGYALSVDPLARAKQLALHTYAERNAPLLRRVLNSASDVEERQIAAEMTGYGGSSHEQLRALVRASRDVDALVRNNAIRALGVLARSSARIAAMIPAETFIEMLNSGTWTDRNKSYFVLSAITERRDPHLLARIRAEALTSLIEMARWHSLGHAYAPRLILGRIAGIDEKELVRMIDRGETESIISALSPQRK